MTEAALATEEVVGDVHAAPCEPDETSPYTSEATRLAVIALTAAVGVLVISGAYTAGRLADPNAGWPVPLYWSGQLLILVPVVLLLLRRNVTAVSTLGAVTVFTVAEYLVKVCYSPTAFTFPDELIHWRGTTDLLNTGQLFTVNHALPVAAQYPGLEEATAAISSVTGLPVYASGLLVIGVAHLVFVLALVTLFRRISRSYRLAGIAILLYATNSHFQSFDSMFIYQSLALAFLAVSLLAAQHLSRPGRVVNNFGWGITGLVCVAGTVVTHHVTSYALTEFLLLVALCLLVRSGIGAAWRPGILALSAVTLVLVWLLAVAPDTFDYLRPTFSNLFSAAPGKTTSGGSTTGPLANRLLSAVSVLVLAGLVPLGWRQVWRRRRGDAWYVAMALGALGWYAAIGIRLLVPDGTELAGRASTFTYIPAAFIGALGLVSLLDSSRRLATARTSIGTGLVTLLLCNGLANGWPPYWERLPGRYLPAAFERSVKPEGIAASEWTRNYLGPGQQFATDIGNDTLLANFGEQNVARDIASLFISSGIVPADIELVQQQSLRYLLVDRRLSTALPPNGNYFPVDPNAGRYTSPIALSGLDKFDRITGVHRIFDSGDIVIYDLKGSRYAP